MTKLPVEQVRMGKGLIPSPKRKFEDLTMCAKADCDYLATDPHHIVRRSHLAGPYDYVEIDGTPRVNVCGLCHLCHHEITTNKAQILWDDQWVWCQTGKPLAPLDTGLGLEALPPLPLKEEVCVERDNSVERHPSHAPGLGSVGTEPTRSITPGSGATSSRQPDLGSIGGDQDESSSQSPVSSEGDRESASPGKTLNREQARRDADHGVAPSRSFNPAPSEISPGDTCPTCDRRVPHKPTQAAPKTTKQLNLGHAPADVIPRLKDRLDDFALSAGITEKAYHRVKALDLLLIIAAQISAEALEGYAAHVDEELGWAA